MKVYPSIASADPLRIAEELDKIRGHPRVHVDIEDGNFLPNITFGQKTVRKLMQNPDFVYDLHLFTTRPYEFLQQISDCHFSHICFHFEASAYPLREINLIRKMGAKPGIALNFKTGIRELTPFLSQIEYLLIMTAEPDGEEEKFQSSMLEKLKEAREYLPQNVEIWADGGINEGNIYQLKEAGADAMIMGRAVWNCDNPLESIRRFEKI